MATYRGFSTFSQKGNFGLTDKQLVLRDILNHIYTIPGERVMMPEFGTRIPLLAFEPLDEDTLAIVREDLIKVFSYDPRVEMIDLSVQALPNSNAIIAFVDVRYVELNITETLKLDFQMGE
jgi:phage baseplate assembly protein W